MTDTHQAHRTALFYAADTGGAAAVRALLAAGADPTKRDKVRSRQQQQNQCVAPCLTEQTLTSHSTRRHRTDTPRCPWRRKQGTPRASGRSSKPAPRSWTLSCLCATPSHSFEPFLAPFLRSALRRFSSLEYHHVCPLRG